MPKLVTEEPPKRVSKSPEDRPIDSKNVCALCLYNIPRGSLMIVLPGLSMLLVGIVLISLTETSESWNAGTSQLSLMLLVIGGVVTLGGVVFWILMWNKHRPERKKKPSKHSIAPTGRDGSGSVELVAVYHVSNNANQPPVAPAYSVSGPGPSGVITVT